MVAGIAAASIIAYLAALLGMQKRQVYQQIVFLLIYIIGITALAEMDVVLPMDGKNVIFFYYCLHLFWLLFAVWVAVSEYTCNLHYFYREILAIYHFLYRN